MNFLRFLFFAFIMLCCSGLVNGQGTEKLIGSNNPLDTNKEVAFHKNVKASGKGIRVTYYDNNGNQLDGDSSKVKEILGYSPLGLRDTDKLATKNDFTNPKILVAAATVNNQRNDNPEPLFELDGWYRTYFTHFEDETGDLTSSNIAYVEGRTINEMNTNGIVKTAIDYHLVPNAKGISQQSIAFRGDSVAVMIFTAYYSDVVSVDSLRTRWFRSEKPKNSTTWSTPVEVFNGNDYTISRAHNIYKITDNYWIMPYARLLTGGSSSVTSTLVCGMMKSYDAGITWTKGPENIYGAIGEGHFVKDLNGSYTLLLRNKNSFISRSSFFSDTSFTNPSPLTPVMPSQNALSSSFYYEPKNMWIMANMRYSGFDANPNRVSLDISISDNGWSWFQEDNIDFVKSGATLNEPYFYLDTTNKIDPILWVYYSKTPVGSGLYSLYAKPYHLNTFKIRKQLVGNTPLMTVMTNANTSTSSNSNVIQWITSRTAPISKVYYKSYRSSATDALDSAQFNYNEEVGASSPDYIRKIRNVNTDTNRAIGLIIDGNMGKRVPVLSVKSDSANGNMPLFEAMVNSTVIAVSDQYKQQYSKPYNIYNDANTGQLAYVIAGKTSYATENFTLPLGAANFASDSSYTDSLLIGRYLVVNDTNGKIYKNGRDYTVIGAKFKLKNRAAPTGTDTIYLQVRNLWKTGRVAQVLPLDTFTTGLGAAISFSKLLTSYKGMCVRLKSSVTGETKEFGFLYEGYLDTFEVKKWAYWDTCTIDAWYNQVYAVGSFLTVVPLNPAIPPKFRLRNGRAYAEFSGGSSLVAVSTISRAALAFLHQNTSTVSYVGEINDILNTSVYGLYATCQATSSANGVSCGVDNRATQSRNMANSITFNRAVAGQSTAVQIINNGGILNNTKFIAMCLGDMTNSTASLRISSYVNGGAVQQANVLTNAPSSANATSTFSIGSTGGLSIQTGKFYEIIVIPQKLNETQRQALLNNQNYRYQIY